MIDLPPHDVDVNIHPTKEEIRFRRSQDIFKIVYDNARAVYAQRHSITSGGASPQPAPLPGTPAQSSEQPAQPPVSFYPSGAQPWNLVSKKAAPSYASRVASPVESVFFPAENDEPRAELPQIQTKRYVGQSAEGFLIFDFPEALAIMDPHAAHERILFEEICESFRDNVATQRLTLPMEIPAAVRPEAEL